MKEAPKLPVARPLAFELLENRLLLAGNVLASVDHGDLVVRGDGADNAIQITQESPGIYKVTGLDGTTVNGVAAFTNTTEVTDDFDIRMHKGADHVLIQGTSAITVPDDLRVRTGRGNDGVSLKDVTVNDDTQIRLRADDDSLNIVDSTFKDHFKLRAATGLDKIAVEGSQFDDDADLRTGAGDDIVVLCDSTFNREAEAHLRDGADTLYVGGSTFHDKTELFGGDGTDLLKVLSGNTFDSDPELHSITREEHLDQNCQDVLNDLNIDAFVDDLLP